MKTFDPQTLGGEGQVDPESVVPARSAILNSPFASSDLMAADTSSDAEYQSLFELSSPFTESFTAVDEVSMESEVMEMLLAELEDPEFAEALEGLADEAARRYMNSTAGWSQEAGVPLFDPADAEQWMESVATRAEQMFAEVEERFRDRSVESITDAELDEALERSFPLLEGFADPLDAEELFWGWAKKAIKKVKKYANKARKFAKKFSPIHVIYGRLKRIIRPLLKKVLAKAIGRLPRYLRGPASKLARKYGLREASEFESDFEYLAAEFDMYIAEAIVASDANPSNAVESEIAEYQMADSYGPNVVEQVDAARERLTQHLLEAEEGDTPVEAMEQFIPILPIVKLGIKLAGRKRVISFVARLLAKLIRPVVGRRLARPLAAQIADKGLALLNLEAETDDGRLAAEALVAATEETVAEVFAMPDEMLENELILEAAVEEAFQAATTRHFPGTVLRNDLVDPASEDERGVWVMMPRATSPLYRYKKYSKALPVVITRHLARETVFSDGETLEDRLADEGVDSWPIDGEVEAFELLPETNIGHLVTFESDSAYGSPYEAALEFDTLEEAGSLPLPPDMERSARSRRGRNRKVVRIRARGRGVRRRKSPVSIRLDLSGAQPAMRLHVWVSERRAHSMAEQLQKQQHRDVVAIVKAITASPIRRVVAKRLGVMLKRRKITRDQHAVTTLTDQLFDGLVTAVAKQLPGLAPTLLNAAKDPAAGLTFTTAFGFPSKDAIAKSKPNPPILTIRPGRRRD